MIVSTIYARTAACTGSTAPGLGAEPDEVMQALVAQGFEEYKREIARAPHGTATGGVWQGLNPHTGAVASTIWFHTPSTAPTVFITIDGHPLTGT